MKTLLSFCLIVLTIASVSAQTINADVVPSPVKNKLSAKYPDAKGIVWKQSDAGFVEATFSSGEKKISSLFSASGDWVSSDYEVTKNNVPGTINEYLVNTQFADYTTKYYKSESSAKGIQYSVDAKKDGRVYEFVFNEAGEIIMRGLKGQE